MLISDFDYPLPDERIARFPPTERDAARLLVWRAATSRSELGYAEISETVFRNIGEVLPSDATLVFNDTRVVRARLAMFRPSGARIEILCLEPHDPADYERAFAARSGCEWRAMIGNAKKWKSGPVEIRGADGELLLRAWRALPPRPMGTPPYQGGENVVKFEWPGDETFGQKLEQLGRVPIPPYLDRDTHQIDAARYQTVYASIEGSVAAPTAGLHFTPEILAALPAEHITLHVGAGTFLPVKSDDALEHPMHSEHFEVSLGTVERLSERLRAGGRVVAVGTTSVRTLESLAVLSWRLKSHTGRGGDCGGDFAPSRVKAAEATRLSRAGRRECGGEIAFANFQSRKKLARSTQAKTNSHETPPLNIKSEGATVGQFAWRDIPEEFTGAEALENLAAWMREKGLKTIKGETRIMITPGYKFRVVGGLVTNFHQPKSTLLLLVSAFLGDPPPTHEEPAAESPRLRPRWREIYDYALAHDFRFLSYGDSSLLLP